MMTLLCGTRKPSPTIFWSNSPSVCAACHGWYRILSLKEPTTPSWQFTTGTNPRFLRDFLNSCCCLRCCQRSGGGTGGHGRRGSACCKPGDGCGRHVPSQPHDRRHSVSSSRAPLGPCNSRNSGSPKHSHCILRSMSSTAVKYSGLVVHPRRYHLIYVGVLVPATMLDEEPVWQRCM